MIILLPSVIKQTQRLYFCKEISENPLLLLNLLLTLLTYARPILEYASIVCSPYVKTDIAKLEMVQHKAAHLLTTTQHTPV